MSMKSRVGLLLVILSTALCLAGCGGGDDNAAPTVDVTGTWRLAPQGGAAFTARLTQSGSSVQGTDSDGGTWAGSVSGDQMAATIVNPDGSSVSTTATVNGNTMTGNYQTSNGEAGTFTGARH
jgi:hypothetical protein